MGSNWMASEPRSDMIYFMISHFHSGSCVDNRWEEDKGGGWETDRWYCRGEMMVPRIRMIAAEAQVV